MKMLLCAVLALGLTVPALAQPQRDAQNTAAITGKPLFCPDGERIGTINSVTNSPNGRMVVVGMTQTLSRRDVLIPLDTLRQRSDGGYLTSLTEGEVDQLPEMSPENAP